MNEQIECVVYEFGVFHADALRRQLLRDGIPVLLTSRAFETLLLLIRHRGKTISKFELMNSIWGDTAVEENNLTQQISTLRRVLGEYAGEKKFIVTIPGRGYCFVALVEEVVAGSAAELRLRGSTRPGITICLSNGRRKARWAAKFDPGTQTGAALAMSFILLVGLCFLWSYTRNPWIGNRPQSLVVLQFRTAAAEDAFLGSGISDTLRARLGSVQDLTLRPSGASLGDQDALAAGREMHVDAVVTGSVQRDRERVRVAVEMLDVADGRIVWGKTFDDNFSNIFELQDSIAGEVARVLHVKFSSGDYRSLRRSPGLAIDGLACEIQRVPIAGRKELEFSA